MTIEVALKGWLQYKNAYQTGKVRPIIVMKALNELCSTSLYKAENICINENWAHVLQENNECIVQNSNNDNESDTNSDANNKAPTVTLVHGLIESQCIYDW